MEYNKFFIKLKDNHIFEKNDIPEEITNVIRREQFNNIIKGADKVIEVCWNKKNERDEVVLPRWMSIFLILASMAGISYMVTLILLFWGYDDENSVLMSISIICISVFFGFISIVGVYNFRREIPSFLKLVDTIKVELDSYFKTINKSNDKLIFTYNVNERRIEVDIKQPSEEHINLVN